MTNDSRRGVLLFNLGGPETLADVRPFLYNLFSDPDIIRIRSRVLRNTVAWLIAATRQRKSRGLYRQIGGGSPLRRITAEQAAALEKRLAERGSPARVYVGMRCWKPSIDDAVAEIAADRIRRIVALPLFPQYSVTTTGSCFNYFKQVLARARLDPAQVSWVEHWHEEPRYIAVMAERIREVVRDGGGFHLLYSAHSIPARYVAEGDPYLDQTRRTMELIDAALGRPAPSTLAFQSKVGPVRWLEPSTRDVILRLARAGTRRLVVVPISFVSDHIETLQEIDILYKDLASSAGIAEFARAPSLNTHPTFIEALSDLVIRALGPP